MEKLLDLIDDLKICYSQKAFYAEEYLKMSKAQQSSLCQENRNRVKRHLFSNDMMFQNIVQGTLDDIRGMQLVNISEQTQHV